MTLMYQTDGAVAAQSSVTTITPALPSLTGRSGGALVAICAIYSTATITTATPGWVKLYQDNSGGAFTVGTFIAPLGSSAPSFTWTGAVDAGGRVSYIEDPDNPMIVNAVGATSQASGTVSPHTSASLTTTRQESLVVAFDTAAINFSTTTPTGWTLGSDAGNVTPAFRFAAFSKFIPTLGDTSGAISVAGGAAAWVQRQIEFRIVLPATGIQTSEVAAAPLLSSGDGISVTEVAASPLYSSGNGIGIGELEAIMLLSFTTPKRIRKRTQVFQ